LAPAHGLQWLAAEQVNLMAVLTQSCATGDHVTAAVLASRLLAGQCLLGQFGDAVRIWRSIITADKLGDSEHMTRAHAVHCLAVACAEGHHRFAEASRLLATCVPSLEHLGDHARAAMGYGLLARCASASGRNGLAISSARSALRLAGPIGDGELTCCAVRAVLGITFARVGMTSLGQAHCRRAVGEARDLGERAYLTAALRALAQALILDRNYAAAADLCEEGISTARDYGSEITAARFLVLLGRARQRCGQWTAAAASLEEARAIFGEVGSVPEELTTSSMLAACCRSAGDEHRAAAHLDHIRQAVAGSATTAGASVAILAACEDAAR
jgi:tetratricopeptide (TPR) repeat protein